MKSKKENINYYNMIEKGILNKSNKKKKLLTLKSYDDSIGISRDFYNIQINNNNKISNRKVSLSKIMKPKVSKLMNLYEIQNLLNNNVKKLNQKIPDIKHIRVHELKDFLNQNLKLNIPKKNFSKKINRSSIKLNFSKNYKKNSTKTFNIKNTVVTNTSMLNYKKDEVIKDINTTKSNILFNIKKFKRKTINMKKNYSNIISKTNQIRNKVKSKLELEFN